MKTLLAAALLLSAAPAFAQSDDPEATPPDVSKLPFTQASIGKVIAWHQPKVQACYEDLLASKERIVEGRILTSFVITAEGLVRDPKVQKKGTTVKDPKLADCVVAVLASMEFPKPKEGREQPIEYPFNLKAIK